MSKIFKVVKIISDTQVVINAGSNDYVTDGSLFEIFEAGEPVIDPDTNKILGNLDYIKAKIEVVTLFPNMCVCTNYQTKTISTLGLSSFTREEVCTLNVNSEQISGGYENIDKKIRIGDRVRII